MKCLKSCQGLMGILWSEILLCTLTLQCLHFHQDTMKSLKLCQGLTSILGSEILSGTMNPQCLSC